MPQTRTGTREYALSEKLLVLAEYWRKCAAISNEPWRSDMMRATAQEFEEAATRATGREALPSLRAYSPPPKLRR